jgi:hypothetical protein
VYEYRMSQPKKTFTLYLNSNTGFSGLLSNGSTANVSWLVDWDSLFNRENYKYEHCQVRVQLVGEKSVTQETSSVSGILLANFGQNFTSKNTGGVVLGSIDLIRTVDGAAASNTGCFISVNTMTNALGQNINMPVGLSTFTLQMWRNGYGAIGDAENILITNAVPYYVMLQFELY